MDHPASWIEFSDGIPFAGRATVAETKERWRKAHTAIALAKAAGIKPE